MRDFVHKLNSGEYLSKWRGFSPYWLGCFYGDSVILGGEDKFSHCYDFFSGIGDVEWWIKKEIDNLTDDDKDEMESLMKRNKEFDTYLRDNNIVGKLSDLLSLDTHYIHRLGNIYIKEILDTPDWVDGFKKVLSNESILKRIVNVSEDKYEFIYNNYYTGPSISNKKTNIDTFWCIDGYKALGIPLTKEQIKILHSNGYDEDNIPLKSDVEELLNISI